MPGCVEGLCSRGEAAGGTGARRGLRGGGLGDFLIELLRKRIDFSAGAAEGFSIVAQNALGGLLDSLAKLGNALGGFGFGLAATAAWRRPCCSNWRLVSRFCGVCESRAWRRVS